LQGFEKALEVFSDSLPLLRLYFDALIQHCREAAKPHQADIVKLADAAFRLVNLYPAVLLMHGPVVVPLLAGAGDEASARELLAGWYCLANVVHELQPADTFVHRVNAMAALYKYRSLFPRRLLDQLEAYRNGKLPIERLSQLEQAMISAEHLREIMAIGTRLAVESSQAPAHGVSERLFANLYLSRGTAETAAAMTDPTVVAETYRLRQELNAVYNSRSWRITAPLRRAGRLRRFAIIVLDAYRRATMLMSAR